MLRRTGERGRTSGHDDELGDTTVEGLGSLVSTLLELLVVTSLRAEEELVSAAALLSPLRSSCHRLPSLDGNCGAKGRRLTCWMRSRIWFVRAASARGKALLLVAIAEDVEVVGWGGGSRGVVV